MAIFRIVIEQEWIIERNKLVVCETALLAATRLWKRHGQEWIRTTEGVKPADLQSAPFGRFGTYPDFSLRPALPSSAIKVQNPRFSGDGSKVYRALVKAVQADFTAEIEDISEEN